MPRRSLSLPHLRGTHNRPPTLGTRRRSATHGPGADGPGMLPTRPMSRGRYYCNLGVTSPLPLGDQMIKMIAAVKPDIIARVDADMNPKRRDQYEVPSSKAAAQICANLGI